MRTVYLDQTLINIASVPLFGSLSEYGLVITAVGAIYADRH